MAPSQTQERKDLFPTLDGINPAGVFIFPSTALSASDQVFEINATLSHLQILKATLRLHSLKEKQSSVVYLPVFDWILKFESMLIVEKKKLLEIGV